MLYTIFNTLFCKGKQFHFGGCGWSVGYAKTVLWSPSDIVWIADIDKLFTDILGEDYLEYKCDKLTKVIEITPESLPTYQYRHDEREKVLPVINDNKSQLPNYSKKEHTQPITTADNKSSKQNSGYDDPPKQQSEHNISTKQGISKPIKTKPIKNQQVFSDLKKCTSTTLTRREISELNLPPIVMLSDHDLEIVQSPIRYSNPLLIAARPERGIINKCKELLKNPVKMSSVIEIDDDDDDDEIGVQVGGLGIFNRCTLDIWEKAHIAFNIRVKVCEEIAWLTMNKDVLTLAEMTSIQSMLVDARPNDEVLKVEGVIVDTDDLTTLVDERCLTGFLIDMACLKYNEQKADSTTLYLPTFCQEWTKGDDQEFLKEKVNCYIKTQSIATSDQLKRLTWVLTPLHLANSHWGLLAINIQSRQILYDDGLHWKPPSYLVPMTKKLLQCLHNISGKNSIFDDSKWDHSLPVSHFGMPDQPAGSQSCGIGVILSFKTLMNTPGSATIKFDWSFQDMAGHRCRLLKQFHEWKQHTS